MYRYTCPTATHHCALSSHEKVNLIAYSGQTINAECTTLLVCEKGQLRFHVVDHNVRPLLVSQDSIAMGLIQFGPRVHTVQEPQVCEFSAW